ncbi:sulfatase-like hydrolase/transferase [uncultured Algibacter sp.]|uniref:sulfatase-like hydrolase/transferase n=1 Tax=uncultured Algibacter sp. TaxID=298659 RepID=UPI0026390BD4|nr:sulfatase-like hydrolase/transferase [uncultured Algibacter sp.]
MKVGIKFLFFLILTIMSCSDESVEVFEVEEELENSSAPTTPNILLIIADDMGLDACPGYDIGNVKPHMPNLQSLINSGVRFTNLWSNPTCTPTRAGIITGRYGFRTNVLAVDDPLSTSETSIQKYLDLNTNNTYAHAVIGKWHLSKDDNHPNDMGVDYFAGFTGGGVPSYTNWTLNVNGVMNRSTEYTTTRFTDLAIEWKDNQTQPWLLWLAYNAPHTPFHLPPEDLHYQGALSSDQSSIDINPLSYYLAALEALDTEMGRLINSLSNDEKVIL